MYKELFYDDIIPIELEDKDYYYYLIYEMYFSFTSMEILNILNSNRINFFIRESSLLLANSIKLFEFGYFDAAYYSMRSAIELATVMLDLSDHNDNKKRENMESFLTKEYRIKRKQTINFLSKNGIVFRDIPKKMPNFLDEIEETAQMINHKVHKASFDNFLTIHKLNADDEEYMTQHKNNFKFLLEKSIKIVAMMRLILEPIPLLMSEEEIYYRIPNIMEYEFNQGLLDLIGEKTLSEFKQTENYLNYKNEFMKLEKRNESTNSVVLHNYIDLNNLDEIYEQKHLLDSYDLNCVNIASCSDKIIHIIYKGSARYSTNSMGDYTICNSLDFNDIIALNEHFNLKYNDIYVSILGLDSRNDLKFEDMWDLTHIFHKELLSNEEIDLLNKL